jgi:hypothetical protein
MSRKVIDRRQFLTLPMALLVAPPARAQAALETGRETSRLAYGVDVSLLYGVLNYRVEGTMTEAIERTSGRYDVVMAGEGDGIVNRIESAGALRQGRWAPLRSRAFFSVKGRESRADITYDHVRRSVEYHFKGETFFLRRLRVVDDVVAIPEGLLVDDSVSAMLNYADKRWEPRADGSFLTHVVRRQMARNEGPDDVQARPRAELAPFKLEVAVDAATRKPLGQFDLTRFSSWAKPDQPARVTFGPDRRPEHLSLPMILGSSVQIRLRSA